MGESLLKVKIIMEKYYLRKLMKSIKLRMVFYLEDDFLESAVDILKRFFTNFNSIDIKIYERKISINECILFVIDEEFYFYEFLDKSDIEINNSLQFYESLSKKSSNKWDKFHRYKFGYKKYQIISKLLKNCKAYFIDTLDENNNTITSYEHIDKEVSDLFIF